jgi:TRAP-type C4-dicarboxylate transport system permease small subunit
VAILARLNHASARIEGILIVVSLWCMVASTFVTVCLRGLHTKLGFAWANSALGSIAWSEEFARMLVLWVSLLGASLLLKDGSHIRIDLFSRLSSARGIRIRDSILSAFACLCCAIAASVSYQFLKIEIEFSAKIFLGLPAWFGQMILPLAFSIMTFRYGLAAVSGIRRDQEEQ